MPSKSKAQQKFMGAVYALKKGDIKSSDVTPAVRKVAKDMKKSDAKDFASTKHKGLPKKIKQEIAKRLRDEGKLAGPMAGSYAIPSQHKKRKHSDKNNLGKRHKDGNSGQPDLDEGMFSTLDQIRQDSKNVRDFVKNVFADRDFKKMKNDKEFIKYLKSIYEGVSEGSFQRGTRTVPPKRDGGLNHHILNKSKVRKHDDDANFKKKYSGQDDIDEMKLDEIGLFPITNYMNGIIPSNFVDTTTRQKKERLRSTLKDLKNTLNYFWKQHKIPYRIK